MKQKIVSLLAVALFWAAAAAGQGDKPDAAVAPVAALGELSEAGKAIIFNSLQSNLSQTYQLVSQEDYAKAETKAFEQLEAGKCTAEQCILKVQEILQVERLFVLQLIREKDFTQLSLTLARVGDKIVREDTCIGCGIGQLHAKVQGLVEKITVADLGRAPTVAGAAPPSALQRPPAPAPPSDVPATPELAKAQGGGVSWWVWVAGGLILAALAAGGGSTTPATAGDGGTPPAGDGSGGGGSSGTGTIEFTY